MRGLVVAAVLATLLASPRAWAVAVQVEVYLVYWPSVGGTANEAELDRFMDCLLLGTTYDEFFSTWGGATLIWGGSLAVSTLPGDDRFGACDGDVGYVDNLINHGVLPLPSRGVLPLYVFMVPEGLVASNCYDAGSGGCNSWPDCGQLCENGVCGLNPGETNYDVSQPWLEAWVTTYATCCWPSGRTDLNLETSVIEHEVAEAVANAMGGLGTCGDGCENETIYPFTGCPSAAGRPSDWYVLQNLSTVQTGACNYEVQYTGLSCGGLQVGCAGDGDCCAPLACQRGAAGASDGGGLACCYPPGARCALSTDCCSGLPCSGGYCIAVLDGGVDAGLTDAGIGAEADAGSEPDAGTGGGQGASGALDGGKAKTGPAPGRGCSSGGGDAATCVTWVALGLAWTRRRMLASAATEAP